MLHPAVVGSLRLTAEIRDGRPGVDVGLDAAGDHRLAQQEAVVSGGRGVRVPLALFIAWALHDVEEAVELPRTCDRLAERSGIDALRMSSRQSWAAVGFMGVLVAAACLRGAQTGGGSRLYRAVVAGLEVHVGTHLLASAVQRRYTAGVLTALPVMLPGARMARQELERAGAPLRRCDYVSGAALLLPAAIACHAVARMLPALRR